MGKRVDFVNNTSVITEDWLDDLQEILSRHVDGLRLERVTNTQLRAALDGQGSVVTDDVSGVNKWRYVTVPPTVTVSGASGARYIYAVGGADSGVDPATNSNKTFTLEASTGAASGTNARLLGTCAWNGSSVSNIRFTAGQQPPADLNNAFEITPNDAGGVPLTLRGYSAQTADLFRVGTSSSASDRAVINAAGQLALPVTGSTGGLLIGGDATLYRSASSTLRTSGALTVDSTFIASANASIGGSGSSIGFYGTTPVTRVSGYSASNVSTDRAFDASSTTVNELANVLGTLINDLKNTGLIA